MKKKTSIYSILKKSLPAAVDLASQPVLWLVEAIFIGHLSAAALGGVGFALQIILLTTVLLLTFVIGATILINRHLGSNDRWGANHILGQTIMGGLLLSVPIGLVWYFGSPLLFRFIHEQELITSLSTPSFSGIESGVQYLRTVSFFVPVLVTNFIAVGMIRGSGDTHISMIINITMNIVHVLLAPILIFGLFGLPRLEIKGAAYAMGIAHTLGFSMTLYYLRRKTSTLFLSFSEIIKPRLESFKKLFKMGLPTTVEQLVWAVGQLVATVYVAIIGIRELAIHQILLRVQGVLSMFYLGFGIAAMTFMGKNLGANEHHMAEHTGKITHRIVFIFGVLFLFLIIIFARPLIQLFIKSDDVLLTNYPFRAIFIFFALVQVPKAMNAVISGSLRGAGDIKWIMGITILTVLLFELGANWINVFVLQFGLVGIWTVQGLDEIARSGCNYLRFRGGKWKLIRV